MGSRKQPSAGPAPIYVGEAGSIKETLQLAFNADKKRSQQQQAQQQQAQQAQNQVQEQAKVSAPQLATSDAPRTSQRRGERGRVRRPGGRRTLAGGNVLGNSAAVARETLG